MNVHRFLTDLVLLKMAESREDKPSTENNEQNSGGFFGRLRNIAHAGADALGENLRGLGNVEKLRELKDRGLDALGNQFRTLVVGPVYGGDSDDDAVEDAKSCPSVGDDASNDPAKVVPRIESIRNERLQSAFPRPRSEDVTDALPEGVVPAAAGSHVQETSQDQIDGKLSELSLGDDDDEGDVYNFNHTKRGRAVIINNENFTQARQVHNKIADREGSTTDANELEKTLSTLGFDVLLFSDLTHKDMVGRLQEAAGEGTNGYDHKDADCFVCVILTHGEQKITGTCREDGLLGVDGVLVSVKAVIELFDNNHCPGLRGKPRMFFFQACRGHTYDSGADVVITKSGDVPADFKSSQDQNKKQDPEKTDEVVRVSPAPLYKDFLVMYATPPGYYAWRSESEGSWFIQSLCKVLSSGMEHKPFTCVLVKVCGEVARNREHLKSGSREMPVIESMLVKDIIFSKK